MSRAPRMRRAGILQRALAVRQALPWILFMRDRSQFEREFPQWQIGQLRLCSPLRYLLSGGISLRVSMPAWTFEFWGEVERVLEPWLAQCHVRNHRPGARSSPGLVWPWRDNMREPSHRREPAAAS